MTGKQAHFRTIIVGSGPAGLAPLVSASRDGRLDKLLAGGLAIIESTDAIGAGRLGRYAITSDSTAETFLTAVTGHADKRLERLLSTQLCLDLAKAGRGAVPLAQAAALMSEIGTVLAEAILDTGGSVLTRHEALQARQGRDGAWTVTLRQLDSGLEYDITADTLLLATGGEQSLERLRSEKVAGLPLWPTYEQTLLLSDDALQPSGLALIRHRLAQSPRPQVAIAGGSTSALAAAGLLLRACPEATSTPGSITILHRRPLRVFYPSADAALADGYTDFGPEDVCSLSGFVFRLAGLRLDSRDLLMGILGLGGRPPEQRVVLHRLDHSTSAESHRVLASADVVIAALGYRPRALALYDADGDDILLRGRLGKEPLVDDRCRICNAEGHPIANLFGIGLAAGFRPHGPLGGEPSFVGQANGLWLWQTAVGSIIVDSLLAASLPERAPLGLVVSSLSMSRSGQLAG
ncbi:hypothetical protein [Lichenifustis flavocetrariae]|uniref:FAD/NAD(P)-binding domain-containing protein n=1 Tax=Lichenifustis flavocetrariae TaxID=2949735 RepID=A0AA42CN54_9HYPH|nr:hypothetical protein [Lichenifustis flavocetrariae]MCW6509035.1 hypothetical protein [Lichenifustis flavocetrariae]